MRYTILISIVCFLFSPATSTVVVNCTDLGNGVAELSYDSTQESLPVRAFALDIIVSQGVILSTDNWSDVYWVYPGGGIEIDPETGELVDNSNPVVSPGGPDTLGGLGTSGITLEMGALYPPSDPPPPPTGVLLTFTVSMECDVTITENLIRGGITLEDASEADLYAPISHMTPEPTTILLLGMGICFLNKRR